MAMAGESNSMRTDVASRWRLRSRPVQNSISNKLAVRARHCVRVCPQEVDQSLKRAGFRWSFKPDGAGGITRACWTSNDNSNGPAPSTNVTVHITILVSTGRGTMRLHRQHSGITYNLRHLCGLGANQQGPSPLTLFLLLGHRSAESVPQYRARCNFQGSNSAPL